jgi:hypothetical protein
VACRMPAERESVRGECLLSESWGRYPPAVSSAGAMLLATSEWMKS